jgi:hypothetical protein
VEVPLDDTSYNNDLAASLRSGAIDGMSFRFSVKKDSWQEPARKGGLPIRTLEEVRLAELGPVTFPAYAGTSATVRSVDQLAQILRTSHPEAVQDTSDEEAAVGDGVAITAPPTDQPPVHWYVDPHHRAAALIRRSLR